MSLLFSLLPLPPTRVCRQPRSNGEEEEGGSFGGRGGLSSKSIGWQNQQVDSALAVGECLSASVLPVLEEVSGGGRIIDSLPQPTSGGGSTSTKARKTVDALFLRGGREEDTATSGVCWLCA